MRISLKPKHLKRYKDIALLLIKHGRSDVVTHAGLAVASTDWFALLTRAPSKSLDAGEDGKRPSGVTVLHGAPGTGKTSFLRALTSRLLGQAVFFYVPVG